MKRITVALLAVFLFTAAFSYLDRIYTHKFLATTGRAQWIWAAHRMSDNEPVVFFAARDFDLPQNRYYTLLKVTGDPEYTLYFNGREIASRRVGDQRQLDVYDVSKLAKTGRNRIVVAVRAPQGIGGLIASIDIAPETENWIVSDGSWRMYRRWHPDILVRDRLDVWWNGVMIVGQPPIGRWNYLALVRTPLSSPVTTVIPPRDSFPMIAYLPTIRTRSGIAVAVADRKRATVYDFGFTRGRIRLVADKARGVTSRVVRIRFAYARNELGSVDWNLRPVVFAPGETEVTTPESHSFRYVTVFGRGVRAEVVR